MNRSARMICASRASSSICSLVSERKTKERSVGAPWRKLTWVARAESATGLVWSNLRPQASISFGIRQVTVTGFVTAKLAPWQVSVGLPQEIAYAEVAKRLHASVLFLTITFGAALGIAWVLVLRIDREERRPVAGDLEAALARAVNASGILTQLRRVTRVQEMQWGEMVGSTLNLAASTD